MISDLKTFLANTSVALVLGSQTFLRDKAFSKQNKMRGRGIRGLVLVGVDVLGVAKRIQFCSFQVRLNIQVLGRHIHAHRRQHGAAVLFHSQVGALEKEEVDGKRGSVKNTHFIAIVTHEVVHSPHAVSHGTHQSVSVSFGDNAGRGTHG